MRRLLSVGVVVAFVACCCRSSQAQFVDGFETGAPGWTFDAPVGPAPGCQWAADGTPAGASGLYWCGIGILMEPSVATGAAALNWNDGTSIQFGSTTTLPFSNSATGPSITLTTLTGSTLNFDCWFEMASCNDETEPHERWVDFVDAGTGSVIASLQVANFDSVPASSDTIVCGTDMTNHHIHSIALDTIPGLVAASTPLTFRLRFRVTMTGYLGDIGLGTDFEDDAAGWFVDDVSVLCPDALVPTVPTLLTPPDAGCSTSPVLLDWTDSTDTTSCGPGAIANYDIDVATDPGFLAIVASGTFTGSSVLFGAPPGTYYWRVRSRDLSGNVSGYASASFDLEAAAAPLPPDTLFVNETAQGAQAGDAGFVDPVIDESPVFSAIYRDPNCGDFAAQYRFQVSTDPTWATVDFDSGTVTLGTPLALNTRCPDLSISISLSRDTVYYWRIQFTDLGGLTGLFSAAQSFRIGDDWEFGVRPGSTNHSRRCWIATAAWGSPEATPVLRLQGWRSEVMETAGAGRFVSRTYHHVGKDLAPAAKDSVAARVVLAPLASAASGDASMLLPLLLAIFGLIGARRLLVRS